MGVGKVDFRIAIADLRLCAWRLICDFRLPIFDLRGRCATLDDIKTTSPSDSFNRKLKI